MIYSISDISTNSDEGKLLLCAISRLVFLGVTPATSEQVLRELNESCERIFGDNGFVSL